MLAVGAIYAGQAAQRAAPFAVDVKVNGLEIELVKSPHGGFSLRVRRH